MASAECRDYLAARILAENKPVTYRLLSRALEVNVNAAKRMLYDFHQTQNSKKSGSIHATYLLCGTKRALEHTNGVSRRDGEDTIMPSSPPMSSMPETHTPREEPVKRAAIVLCREEELEKTRAEYEHVSSIHIYSLEAGPIENLSILTSCNHEASAEFADQEPMERWRRYGSIQNTHVQRRTAKYAPPTTVTTTSTSTKPASKPALKAATKLNPTTQVKNEDDTISTKMRETSESKDSSRPSTQPATLRRSDSKSGDSKKKTAGDIFKSFAKAKAKPSDSQKSQESTPAPVEDDAMGGMSEDEAGDDEPQIEIDESKNQAARKAREERAEKLRKMMDDDDEEMPDAPPTESPPAEATPTGTPTGTQSTATDAVEPEPEPETTVKVENGRRRGRRRVMKKKKVKDEDGYLVTKEEAVWESFSEDEPEPKKLKPSLVRTASGTKGKGGAGKKGQGSIASFFKKG